jgi:hypothetical protein
VIFCIDCRAVGDTDAEGWTHGTGEDDSHRCPACSAQIAADTSGWDCEHDAIEWPTADPPPDDMAGEIQARSL